jgi:copper(I)-binding protein
MLVTAIIAALQISVAPAQSPSTAPARGALYPAGNEIVHAGDLTLSNGHITAFGRFGFERGGFIIRNDGDQEDRLISVSSVLADQVTMWRIETTGERRGEVEQLVLNVPAHSGFTPQDMDVDSNRGRIQLRFKNLRMPSDPAEGIPVTFLFEVAGEVTVRAYPVLSSHPTAGSPSIILPGSADEATGSGR